MGSKRPSEDRQFERLLSELRQRKDILAGTLSQAYLPCNKGNCKCTRGKLHGPTWRIGYKENSKTTTVYVRQRDLDEVKAAVKRYASIRAALQHTGRRNLRRFARRAKRRKH